SLLEAIEELLLVVSPEGTILFASSKFRDLTGEPAEDLVGCSVTSLFVPEDSSAVRRLLREASFGPKANGRCRLQTKHGEHRWFDAVARDRSLDPAIQGLLLILSDASAAYRMESERQVISEVVHALNATSNLDQLLSHIHQSLKGV